MHLLNRLGKSRYTKRSVKLTEEEKRNITLNNGKYCGRHLKAYERECIHCMEEKLHFECIKGTKKLVRKEDYQKASPHPRIDELGEIDETKTLTGDG